MSTVYNLEPPPTAKCILHTTTGSVTISLFAQQTPLTSRNFLQHLLDGYYTNTIFHRLVPGFILQGGDPTGTGSGGSSSFEGGRPFQDEFHSRLKFNRRGLLGMANTGKDDNGSQFFFTLGKAEELNGRHTMFGRIEDQTIFNLVKMGEAELSEGEGSERPMYPTRITGAEVLVNPFEGMVARLPETAGREPGRGKVEEKKKGVKRKPKKGLLSFAGEEGEEDMEAPVVKNKFDAKLIDDEGAAAPAPGKRKADGQATDRAKKRRATSSPSPEPVQAAAPQAHKPKEPSREASPSVTPEPETKDQAPSALERANAQIAELKKSLQRNVAVPPEEQGRKKSALEQMIPTTATRGRRRKAGTGGVALGSAPSREEQRALDSFNAFKQRLDAAPAQAQASKTNGDAAYHHAEGQASKQQNGANGPSAEDDEANLCDLHFVPNCQSCMRWDEEDVDGQDDDDNDPGWMSLRLTFEKDRLGKDLQWKKDMENKLVVIDPREREKEIATEQKEKRRERKEKAR